jgi:hypothetical protein
MENEKIIEIGKVATEHRGKEYQETVNHLILGITMWVSASLTCITTLITVKQPWCLVALFLPFIYTMFPQIQKFSTALSESGYRKYMAKREAAQERKKQKEMSFTAQPEPETVQVSF